LLVTPLDFEGIPAATVYEAAGARGDMAPSIRPISPGRLVGPAFTVKCLVGDALAVFRAIERAQPGDVLVIDAGGTDRATAWGGTMAHAAIRQQIAGCVTNGAIRDTADIRALAFPVYGAGTSVRGTRVAHPGWLNVTVSVGDVAVSPGDWIVADEDGIVVVPRDEAAAVAAAARILLEHETARDQRIDDGEAVSEVLRLYRGDGARR
jgi:4-hydroxy-4-methyl-2-oxoglutarate aldolase